MREIDLRELLASGNRMCSHDEDPGTAMELHDAGNTVWAAAVVDVSGQPTLLCGINDMVLIDLEEVASQVSRCICALSHICYGPPNQFANIFAHKLSCGEWLCIVSKNAWLTIFRRCSTAACFAVAESLACSRSREPSVLMLSHRHRFESRRHNAATSVTTSTSTAFSKDVRPGIVMSLHRCDHQHNKSSGCGKYLMCRLLAARYQSAAQQACGAYAGTLYEIGADWDAADF